MAAVPVQRRADEHVAHVDRRRGEEAHVAEDAAQPPHVLVFEVAPVGPLEDLHVERVPAGPEEGRDVEFRRHVAALAVADPPAVDPAIEGAVHAVEDEEDLPPLPVRWSGERAAVEPRRVLLRDARRVYRVGVVDVGVLRNAVAVHLPVARDGDAVPAGGADSRIGRWRLGRGGEVAEGPLAAQQAEERRGCALAAPGGLGVRIRQQRRVSRLAVAVQKTQILPIIGSRIAHGLPILSTSSSRMTSGSRPS